MSSKAFLATRTKRELQTSMFMYHTPSGANQNQKYVVSSNYTNLFGTIVVNDWPCYDSLSPTNAKLVARVQGIHVQAGMKDTRWYNSHSLEFVDARYKRGSTLQLMGPVIEAGEWAIVGGTGEFTLAQGVIEKKFVEQQSDGNIMELNIHAFYYPHSEGKSLQQKGCFSKISSCCTNFI